MTQHTQPKVRAVVAAGVVVAGLLVAACGDDGTSGSTSSTIAPDTSGPAVIDPGDGGDYQPMLDPADFVDGVDHPYFPLAPGATWVYESEEDGSVERIEVVVTSDRKEVMGIPAVVVRDTVHVDGELVEDTFDWFAQDREGNVWYLGEDTTAYEDGTTTAAGSWEAGVDGAQPGIVMPARPHVGDAYRQEYLAGEAEDMGEVLAVDGSASVAFGAFEQLVVTEDWTPLEPDVVENKYYARGIGNILEVHVRGGGARVELVSFTPGPTA